MPSLFLFSPALALRASRWAPAAAERSEAGTAGGYAGLGRPGARAFESAHEPLSSGGGIAEPRPDSRTSVDSCPASHSSTQLPSMRIFWVHEAKP